MTTLAVRVPDPLLQRLDALVAAGGFPTRTAAVREALERLLADERRQEVDRAIAAGYERTPPEPVDPFSRSLAECSVMQEPW